MFTAADLKKASAIARRVTLIKRAAGFFNPYDAEAPSWPKPQLGWYSHIPKTFGDNASLTGRGIGQQLGNYGQLLFTGHGGKNSLLGNYAGYGLEAGMKGLGDAAHNISGMVTGGPGFKPDWHSSAHALGRLGSSRMWRDPLQRAMPGMQESWRNTGALGGWAMGKVAPMYQGVKDVLLAPRVGF